MRKGGAQESVSWEEALSVLAGKMSQAKGSMAGVVDCEAMTALKDLLLNSRVQAP